jgi:hypothetical protein
MNVASWALFYCRFDTERRYWNAPTGTCAVQYCGTCVACVVSCRSAGKLGSRFVPCACSRAPHQARMDWDQDPCIRNSQQVIRDMDAQNFGRCGFQPAEGSCGSVPQYCLPWMYMTWGLAASGPVVFSRSPWSYAGVLTPRSDIRILASLCFQPVVVDSWLRSAATVSRSAPGLVYTYFSIP